MAGRKHQRTVWSTTAHAPTPKLVDTPGQSVQETTTELSPKFTWGPFKEGELLGLPREIRNQIYELALETVTMNLKTHGVSVFASPPLHVENNPHSAWHATKGLPAWLLACKQLCEEGTELIVRNWRFRPLGQLPFNDATSAAMTNPLIFQARGPQHIVIRPTFFIADDPLQSDSSALHRWDTRETEAVPRFVKMLHDLDVTDLSLETTWERWWHVPSRNGFHVTSSTWSKDEPEILWKEWDSSWDGKFRKVAITVKVWSDPDSVNISSELMTAAAHCARKLVGQDSEITWKDLGMAVEFSEPAWTRRVVVQRKI